MRRSLLLFAMAFALSATAAFGPAPATARQWTGDSVAAAAQSNDIRDTVQSATRVLRDALGGIPGYIVQNAVGVAVFPGVTGSGLMTGDRDETGVLSTHKGNEWSLPVFLSLSGGSAGGLGLRAGGASSDLILVFQDPGSMEELMRGNLALGEDAVVAAGPVGASGPITESRADVLSYRRTNGTVSGALLAGGDLNLDNSATQDYYYIAPGPAGGGFTYYESPQEILSMNNRAETKRIPPDARELQRLLRQSSLRIQQ